MDERRELAVDPQTGSLQALNAKPQLMCAGLKNYIATENIGIATSAGLVRNLFGRSIQLGRQYARSRNQADLYEALRLLGTGCHWYVPSKSHHRPVSRTPTPRTRLEAPIGFQRGLLLI